MNIKRNSYVGDVWKENTTETPIQIVGMQEYRDLCLDDLWCVIEQLVADKLKLT